MKIKFISVLFCVLSLIGCTEYHDGLNTVNKGLDTVNKKTKQTAEPLGKIWALPSSMHEGVLKGYTDSPQENPYDR